jgi:DNA-binding ferritin-like protein
VIVDTLKVILADHVESFLTIQGYHWNVTGSDFIVYHEIFKEAYNFYYNNVDGIGEQIRLITDNSEYVNPSMDVLQKNRSITGEFLIDSPNKMCTEIIKLNNWMLSNYSTLFTEATDEKLIDVIDYATELTRQLKILNWKFLSLTKK